MNLWRNGEAGERFADAAQLIDAAFLKKTAGDDDWQTGLRRAGEILEWLSHPQFELSGVPTRLLGAAAYQLAGYPAMASSLLDKIQPSEFETRLLPPLLKADFKELLEVVRKFWQDQALNDFWGEAMNIQNGSEDVTDEPETFLLTQLIGSLGVLCGQARWGDQERFETALTQLENISNVMLHSGDTYSWLLSKLVAETGRSLEERLLRTNLEPLRASLGLEGKQALELYARYAYQEHRTVIWPSQILGINRLKENESFALCTPTGSGKTAVAEIALLESLFTDLRSFDDTNETLTAAPLGMYLVPSKALAAEAEAKLNRILTRVSSEDDPITVTGLYGGTDWGPTDAWLTREGKTVLICTYEKAEAILRFLGPLFLNRLRLVVIDEAHTVEFNGRVEELSKGESRPLRLETLGARLLTHISGKDTKVIALSAVAGGIEDSLASWVKGKTSEADSSNYRSTRQLIGRLGCLNDRRFDIRYDLLDGASLEFTEQGDADRPFISDPFPAYPSAPKLEQGGPEKKLRPYLFWAAFHLVQSTPASERATVLLFVPTQIGGYAQDLLSLLDGDWSTVVLPKFFEPPTTAEQVALWERCLNCCADYFTSNSREYRLLEKGIIVHHGGMPRSLSRLLIEAVEQRLVNVVLATSTLNDGVNLPFEVLLVPSLRRGQVDVSPREFRNLVGRTGRPGVATEGKTLVLLPNPATDWSSKQAHERYYKIIGSVSFSPDKPGQGYIGVSALAQLLTELERNWEQLPGSNKSTFTSWLDQTCPLNEESATNPAVDSLDVLDSVLLSAIVELEQLAEDQITPVEFEGQLKNIWQRTFAHYVASEESRLSSIFIQRGKALKERVYPDEVYRRKIYKTSIPPRPAKQLMDLYPTIRGHLETGYGYAAWPQSAQFQFIKTLVQCMKSHPTFSTPEKLGSARNAPRWDQVLQWWLHPNGCEIAPDPAKVSDWYGFVYRHFDYRFNWGLSSILSLAFDEITGDSLQPLTLDKWPETDLPWIAFWIKELMIWGTLDPAVAFLLSRRIAWTRGQAEKFCELYYEDLSETDPNIYLDPMKILKWAEERFPSERTRKGRHPPFVYDVELLRDFENSSRTEWRVVPIERGQRLVWVDIAGFPLARSIMHSGWSEGNVDTYDFVLFNREKVVRALSFV